MRQPVTANQRKQIASLQQARNRRATGLFVLEGTRSVIDCANYFNIEMLVATAAWLDEYSHILPVNISNILTARPDDMKQKSKSILSLPKTSSYWLLTVCRIPVIWAL